MRPGINVLSKPLRGFKLLKCKDYVTNNWYNAVATCTIPELATVICHAHNHDLRTDHIVINDIEIKHELDTCFNYYYGNIDYIINTKYKINGEYTSKLDIDYKSHYSCRQGIHFMLSRELLYEYFRIKKN